MPESKPEAGRTTGNSVTIGDVLLPARRRLQVTSPSPGLDAQLLLAAVIDRDRVYVLAHPEHELTAAQADRYQTLVKRREAGEPVAYLLGKRAFYDREFLVRPGVLIPRPETEHLLEEALAFVKQHPDAVCVDVGTGSGILAVTLAANAPGATVYATDISETALGIARENAALHQAEVCFLHGDLLIPLQTRGTQVDLVMANLPYIATDVLSQLEVRKFEPHTALDGGPDGLDLIRRLLAQLPGLITPGGLVLLEIGADQGQTVHDLAQAAFPTAAVRVLQDYADHDRVVALMLPA